MDYKNALLAMCKGHRIISFSIEPYTQFRIDQRTCGIACEVAPLTSKDVTIISPSQFKEKYNTITNFEILN